MSGKIDGLIEVGDGTYIVKKPTTWRCSLFGHDWWLMPPMDCQARDGSRVMKTFMNCRRCGRLDWMGDDL